MSWSIVCTTNAPMQDIARFVAHHLSLGCAHINIFLDRPVMGLEALAHPRLQFDNGNRTLEALHHRQMANAQIAYQNATTDWIAHLDIDEFIIANTPLETALAQLPASADWAMLHPVEPLEEAPITRYKHAPQHVGQPRALLEELYPQYGLLLRTGLLAYGTCKPIARTGLQDVKLGMHKLLGQSKPRPAKLQNIWLAHHHAPSWDAFRTELPRRLRHGSYAAARDGEPSIAELIELIDMEDGDDGLKRFYDALRTSEPDHISALAAHGLLLQHDLDLKRKTAEIFPSARGIA